MGSGQLDDSGAGGAGGADGAGDVRGRYTSDNLLLVIAQSLIAAPAPAMLELLVRSAINFAVFGTMHTVVVEEEHKEEIV